jgi:hypothetical protein
MPIRRNAMLAGLAAAVLIFLCLTLATRLQSLVDFVLALAGGGAVLAVSNRRPARSLTKHVSAPVAMPSAPPPPPPPQPVKFHVRTLTGIRLPSAKNDYDFAFAAQVSWLPTVDDDFGAAEIAEKEIIALARQITDQADPGQVSIIRPQLAAALGALQSDSDGRVRFRADSVQLQLPPEDQQRLDQIATVRKQVGLWEYERGYEISKRHYLRTDVLRDSGSAVVWWLAKHEDEPQEVADKIEVLSRLARAATDTVDVASEEPPDPQPSDAVPETPAARFDAFLDSLASADPDFRLTLTSLVARFVDSLDQKAADEMRRRYREPSVSDMSEDPRVYPDEGYPEYPDDPEDMPPE